MSENDQNQQEPQSGARVGLGILGFIVGIFVLLWLIKMLFGF